MRLHSLFTFETLSNCYLVGPDRPGDAILIDPARFSGELLELIEGHQYYVRTILLTHCDEEHLDGLRPILRVYTEAKVFATAPLVMGLASEQVAEGEIVRTDDITAQAILMPGMNRDSVAWLIDGFLFTGTALTAGEYGRVPNPYAKASLLETVEDGLLSLPDETVVFPFSGPPSTVGVERSLIPTFDPTELT